MDENRLRQIFEHKPLAVVFQLQAIIDGETAMVVAHLADSEKGTLLYSWASREIRVGETLSLDGLEIDFSKIT